jgi:penicillin-binding protein 1C
LVAAYSAFARRGEWVAPFYVVDGSRPEKRSLVSARTAFWITDILSDAEAREYVFGRGGSLDFPFPVAAKTGTSQAYHDNWVVGYSRHVTVGVWVGNFDRKPLRNSSGVTGAGPIFHAVMLAAEKRAARQPNDDDVDPFEPGSALNADIRSIEICALSGLAANEWCPTRRREWVAAGSNALPCSWHHLTDGGTADRVADGISPMGSRSWNGSPGNSCTRIDDTAAPIASKSPDALRISSPPDGATYLIDPTLRREFQALVLRAVTSTPGPVQWSVDERSLGTSESDRGTSWSLVPGLHTFRARDAAGQIAEASIVVR